MKSTLHKVVIKGVGEVYIGAENLADLEKAAKCIWSTYYPTRKDEEFIIRSVERIGDFFGYGWIKGEPSS